jgi:surface protein
MFSFSYSNTKTFNISTWDTSSVTDMAQMFRLTQFNEDITSWDVSSVTHVGEMFRDNTIFNQNISGWNVSSVTSAAYMFDGASAFNQNISSWNTSNIGRMDEMFNGATVFDQNLSNWNITSLNFSISLNNFLLNGTLSTANYDATLIGWAAQTPLFNGLTPNFGGSQYTLGGAAESARNTLINTYGWTITDGGGI